MGRCPLVDAEPVEPTLPRKSPVPSRAAVQHPDQQHEVRHQQVGPREQAPQAAASDLGLVHGGPLRQRDGLPHVGRLVGVRGSQQALLLNNHLYELYYIMW